MAPGPFAYSVKPIVGPSALACHLSTIYGGIRTFWESHESETATVTTEQSVKTLLARTNPDVLHAPV